MRCPIDGTDLQIAVRNGIEIDYCPQCKGVWLDRGELEKLIDGEANSYADFDRDPEAIIGKRKNDEPQMYQSAPPPARRFVPDDDYDSDDDRRDDDRRNKKRRRGSFLGEIFDIFD